jgi:SAM-dependent methyltransferase
MDAAFVPQPHKAPVTTEKPKGSCPDEMDRFCAVTGFENPEQWEKTILRAFEDAKTDADLANVLGYAYLQQDREASFNRFWNTPGPRAISKLLSRLGIGQDAAVADIGCGPGHLAHSLHRLGYTDVTAMDPNAEWFTGTGYLKSLPGHSIKIVNDLDRWRTIQGRYDAIVSSGTVHHWQHIPQAACDTRRVMKPGAYWLMISEYIANTPRELVLLLDNHPTRVRYNSYEWPYPASVYVDLIQSVGLTLIGVVPHFYNDNEFLGWSLPKPENFSVEEFSRQVDETLLVQGGSVDAFWQEVDAFRRGREEQRYYTSPQAFIFQRLAL